MKVKSASRNFGKFEGIGSKNPKNRVELGLVETKELDLSISQNRRNTSFETKLVLPTKRSKKGSRRVTVVYLNGHQTREAYETLKAFFENQSS